MAQSRGRSARINRAGKLMAGALLLRAGWLLVGVVTAATLALVVSGARNAAAGGGVLRGDRS